MWVCLQCPVDGCPHMVVTPVGPPAAATLSAHLSTAHGFPPLAHVCAAATSPFPLCEACAPPPLFEAMQTALTTPPVAPFDGGTYEGSILVKLLQSIAAGHRSIPPGLRAAARPTASGYPGALVAWNVLTGYGMQSILRVVSRSPAAIWMPALRAAPPRTPITDLVCNPPAVAAALRLQTFEVTAKSVAAAIDGNHLKSLTMMAHRAHASTAMLHAFRTRNYRAVTALRGLSPIALPLTAMCREGNDDGAWLAMQFGAVASSLDVTATCAGIGGTSWSRWRIIKMIGLAGTNADLLAAVSGNHARVCFELVSLGTPTAPLCPLAAAATMGYDGVFNRMLDAHATPPDWPQLLVSTTALPGPTRWRLAALAPPPSPADHNQWPPAAAIEAVAANPEAATWWCRVVAPWYWSGRRWRQRLASLPADVQPAVAKTHGSGAAAACCAGSDLTALQWLLYHNPPPAKVAALATASATGACRAELNLYLGRTPTVWPLPERWRRVAAVVLMAANRLRCLPPELWMKILLCLR